MYYVKTYVKRNDGKIFAVWSDDRDDNGVGELACYPVEMERDFDPSYDSCTIIKSEDVVMYSQSKIDLYAEGSQPLSEVVNATQNNS